MFLSFVRLVFESKDKIVLVMDYASGGELYDYINSDSLTPEEARRFFQQIVSAIYYCHKVSLRHRLALHQINTHLLCSDIKVSVIATCSFIFTQSETLHNDTCFTYECTIERVGWHTLLGHCTEENIQNHDIKLVFSSSF